MSDIRLIETREIPVGEIVVERRLRPTDPTGVEAILDTVRDGETVSDPIDVRRIRRQGRESYRLIDGAHRLEAVMILGRPTIMASIWECSDADARMMEVERNLARAEMKPIDRAVFLLEYKEAYESRYPEARAAIGKALIARRWNTTDKVSVVSFAVKMGQMLGLDERSIRRQIRAVQALRPEEISALRSAPSWIGYKDLAEIGRIADAEERRRVVSMLADGRARKASEARRAIASAATSETRPKDPVEEAFKALCEAWSRATPEIRRRFVEEHYDTVQPLVRDVWRARQTMAPRDAARAELERRRRAAVATSAAGRATGSTEDRERAE